MTRRVSVLALAVVMMLGACGATARQRALDTTLAALDAARDGFVAYDSAKQAAIVDAAITKEAGVSALAAWREKRTAVVELFLVAYSALAAACLDATQATLQEAAFAAARAYDAVKHLRGAP